MDFVNVHDVADANMLTAELKKPLLGYVVL